MNKLVWGGVPVMIYDIRDKYNPYVTGRHNILQVPNSLTSERRLKDENVLFKDRYRLYDDPAYYS